MEFYHGGKLSFIDESFKYKSNRVVYGAGLYLTTYYDVAKKYTKGSRKLYKIELNQGNDISDSLLPYDETIQFLKGITTKSKLNLFLNRIEKFIIEGKIKAYNMNVILLNDNLIPSNKLNELRKFYVSHNIDYEVHNNSFGFGETMVVLYNFNLIKTKEIIK